MLKANGFARVRARSPEAFGICDTCGFQFNRTDLVAQMEYQGNALQKTGFMVCTRTCNDVPQPQLTTPILPNDPYPILDPRPELHIEDNFELASTSGPASSATPTSGVV